MTSRKQSFFERKSSDPSPISVSVEQEVYFSQADPMGVVWHGEYPRFFEVGYSALTKYCGLTFMELHKAGIMAPIVKHHIDYYQPVFVGEVINIVTSLIWSEAAKMNIEYRIFNSKKELTTFGYSQQLFVDAKSRELCFIGPGILEDLRVRWRKNQI